MTSLGFNFLSSHIFQCMCKMFCAKFQSVPLNSTQKSYPYIERCLFLCAYVKSPYAFLKIPPPPPHTHTHTQHHHQGTVMLSTSFPNSQTCLSFPVVVIDFDRRLEDCNTFSKRLMRYLVKQLHVESQGCERIPKYTFTWRKREICI